MPTNKVKLLNVSSPLFADIKFGRILKQLITAVNEVITDHATNNTIVTDVKRLANEIRANLVGDYLDSAPGLDVGSTPANVKNVKFDFHINGDEHDQVALAAGTALSGDDVPQSLYGAWALDVGENETIDIIPATDNATGYASAVNALAGIPAVGADHIRMGTVSVIKVDVDFLNSAPTLAIGSSKTAVSHVEFTHWHAQVEKTEPALAAGKELAGSNIPQSLYGAFRLEIGVDETLDLIPASNNATGLASAILALADLPAIQSNHVNVGTLTVIKVDDDFLNSAPTLAIGGTPQNVSHVEFTHWHSQVEKTEPALAAGKILAGDNIPQNLYGAFRLEIGADETLDLIPASNNATGLASAVLALADLPAIQANHVNIGTLTVIKVDDDFLNSAPTLAIGSTPENVSHAEFTHWHSQVEKTEGILAAGMALAGDTVPQNLYGAYRFQIGVDETLDLVQATDNSSGYATAELALDGLPAIEAGHVSVGTVTVFHTDGGGFQPGVTALDAGGTVIAYADGALDGFFIPGTTEIDDGEVAAIYIDGDLDGFFDPGNTDLDDSEVTDVYTDSAIGLNAIGAAIAVSSPATISAGAVTDIEGEIND